MRALLLTLCCLFSAAQAMAQTYTASLVESDPTANSGYYTALAKDNSGNLYVVRYNGSTGFYELLKWTNGNPASSTVLVSSLAYDFGESPWGIAVNSSNGDVFVTSANTGVGYQVLRLPGGVAGSATVVQQGKRYSAICLDNSNNLLAVERSGGAGSNYQVTRYAADGSGGGTVLYSGIVDPGDGTFPWGIDTDSDGNIYVANFYSGGTGGIIKLTAPAFTRTDLATGRFFTSLHIDAANTLYAIEQNANTTYKVTKFTNASGTGTQIYNGLVSDGIVSYPWGIVEVNGNLYVNDGSAITDVNGSACAGQVIKLTPPTITVVNVNRVNTTPAKAATVQYTVTFSGSATGVTTNAFSLTTTGSITGASVVSVTGSGTTYTVNVNTGTGDGTIRLDVNGSGIAPTVTNVPYTSGQTYTIDKTPPAISNFVINSGAASANSTTATLTIAASDASTPLQMAFSNDGVTYSTLETYATTKSWTLTSGDGLKTVYIKVVDVAGNESTQSATITLDQTAPVVTITAGPTLTTNSTTANFTFTANETGSSFMASLDGGPYVPATSPLTFTGLAAGSHTFRVRATDAATNTGTPASYTWTIDNTAPTITSVTKPADGYYHLNDELNFTVHFSENVTVTDPGVGLYLEVTVGSSLRPAVYVSSSGADAVFRYTVMPGDEDMDGIALGSLVLNPGATITDNAGNNANFTLNGVPSLANVRVNTTIPTVTITTTAPSPTNAPFTATITFSEAVTGFATGAITVGNATLSNLQTSDNITYTVDVTPSATGPVTLVVPANAAVNDGQNGNSASNTLSVDYDITPPAVTSVAVPANGTYKAGDNLDFTVNFDENVTVNAGGGIPYINITIGSTARQAAYVSGTGSSALFRYTVQTGDLDNNGIAVGVLTLNSGTIKDAVGNNANLTLNSVGSTAAVLVDAVAPTVTSVTVPANGYYQDGNNLDFTVNFSEAVTVTGTPTIPVTIGSATVNASYISGSGTTALVFRYTVQPGQQDLDGIAVGSAIALSGGTIQDAAANNAVLTLNSIGNTSNVFVYSVVPAVTLSSAAPATLNSAFAVTATFSEAVTGFVAGDVSATNATISNLQTSDNITYTFDVTPAADGAVTVQVPAGSAVNIASNGNTASNTLSFTYDATAPTIASVDVPANGYYKTSGILNFTVNYNEVVTVNTTGGTPYINITIGSTTRQAAYVSGSGSDALVFRYTVQAGEEDMDGISVGSVITLNGGTIQDAATNNAVLTLNGVPSTANVRVHTAVPTVVLSTTAPSLVNGAVTVTATFSEAMAGVALSDFTLTNATASNLQGSGNTVFTVTLTPAADGAFDITFPANKALNIAGTGNTASNTLSFTYDGTAPAITAVGVPANGYYNATTNNTLTFTTTFSENVTVTGTPQLAVVIGSSTVQANYVSGSGSNQLTFSYTVQNGDNDMDGISLGSLTLNGGTIQDAAANNAVLTLNGVPATSGILVNTSAPAVTVSTAATSPGNAPFTVTITFSEAVTGLTAGEITVTNGTAGNLQTTDNITYTADITPAADGNVTVLVPAGAAENVGANPNAASNTLTYVYDATAPVITSVDVPAAGYYKAGDVLSFTVHYSEIVTVVTGGGIPSLNITIGSSNVQAAYVSGSGSDALVFSYTVQSGEEDLDGITLGGSAIGTMQDDAGNHAINTLNNVGNTSGVLVYTAVPAVQLTGTPVANAPFTLTITFSEAVTGFTAADITAANATVSDLQTTDNITYTALVTPVADGTVSVTVPANVAVNVVSNGNTTSNTITYTYDATAPAITSVDVPANGYYTTGDNLDFTVHFSEIVNVSGTPSIPVTIGTAAMQAAYVSGSGTNALLFRYTVQNGDMDLDGIALGTALALNSGAIQDAAANNAVLTINNAGSTANVFVNTTHPTVTVSTAAASRVNTAFTVTVAFSEAVTGFTTTGISAANATVSNLQTTDNITYTATITPLADGPVSVTVPANAAQNIGHNGNTASNTITVTYDATAPVIAAATFDVYNNAAVGAAVGTLSATETAGTLQQWTITADGSGGAFAINAATGEITVKDAAILDSKTGTTVTLTVTVSDGLNTSAPATITINVLQAFINKAPTLDPIANQDVCPGTDAHTIQLTGASAVEPGQTYTITAVSDQPLFDVLSVNASNVLSYQLKSSVTSGTATITVTIKDDAGTANGGVDTLRRSFTITVNPLPNISISSDKGTSISKGDVVHLGATNGNGYSYSWSPSDGIISGQQNAVLEARPLQNITYTVTVTSAAGCSSTADISITVVEDFKVDAVNVLTPNGDGKNDKWVVRNLDAYPDNELSIYDRSGRMVYHRVNYSNDWEGTLNGSPLGEGTYYYILKITGTNKIAKGYITIIRDQH